MFENLFGLEGKTALVTGASSGLGAHFASVLASAGAHVVLAARRRNQLDQIAGAIRASGGSCETLVLDVTNADAVLELEDRFTVDVLVNNAGIVRESPALDLTDSDWDDVMSANLRAAFQVARSVGKGMCKRGRGGSIINIASILGLRQASGVLSYAVSKAGVVQLTKILALELSRFNIRVNALAPGYIATELNEAFWESDPGTALIRRIPQRRLGRLIDLDGALLLLASSASAYMTGAVIPVDGGHLVSGL